MLDPKYVMFRDKLLEAVKDVYVKKGYKDYIPNSMVDIFDDNELFVLGLSSGKRYKLDTLLNRLSLPGTKSPELIKLLRNEFPGIISKKEEREIEDYIVNKKAEEILSELSDEYRDFVVGRYVRSKDVVKNKDYIKSMEAVYYPPDEPTLLSTFGLIHLKDTHGFDKGVHRSFLNNILMDRYQSYDLNNHNLVANFSTNIVYTNNVFINGIAWMSLNVEQLKNLSKGDFVKNEDVYVFENIGVYEQYGLAHPSAFVVCTAGFINLASKMLVKKLIDNGNRLYYSGDLDPTGVKIANGLIKEFPEIIPYKMDAKTFDEYKNVAVKDEDAIFWSLDIIDKDLREVYDKIYKSSRCIYQENIDY